MQHKNPAQAAESLFQNYFSNDSMSPAATE
jgi:hypothetical protein